MWQNSPGSKLGIIGGGKLISKYKSSVNHNNSDTPTFWHWIKFSKTFSGEAETRVVLFGFPHRKQQPDYFISHKYSNYGLNLQSPFLFIIKRLFPCEEARASFA